MSFRNKSLTLITLADVSDHIRDSTLGVFGSTEWNRIGLDGVFCITEGFVFQKGEIAYALVYLGSCTLTQAVVSGVPISGHVSL